MNEFKKRFPLLKHVDIQYQEIGQMQEPYRLFPGKNMQKPMYQFSWTMFYLFQPIFFYRVEWEQEYVVCDNQCYFTEPVRVLYAANVDCNFFDDELTLENMFHHFASRFTKHCSLFTLDAAESIDNSIK